MTQIDPDLFHIRESRFDMREALEAIAKATGNTHIPMTHTYRAGNRAQAALAHICKIKDEDSAKYYSKVWHRVSRIITNRLDPI